MAGHYATPEVTSGSAAVPENHIGENVVFVSHSISGETISGSTTIALCRIPAGAKITGATVQWNASDLSTTTGASLSLQTWTNGTSNGAQIKTTAISTQPQVYSPNYAAMGYRHTASSIAVLYFHDFVGTGTSSNRFNVMLKYVCQNDGD